MINPEAAAITGRTTENGNFASYSIAHWRHIWATSPTTARKHYAHSYKRQSPEFVLAKFMHSDASKFEIATRIYGYCLAKLTDEYEMEMKLVSESSSINVTISGVLR